MSSRFFISRRLKKDRALFNNIYNELTPDLVNDYIDAFLLTSYEFYSQIKGIIHEDEQKS